MNCFVKWLQAAIDGAILLDELDDKLKELVESGKEMLNSLEEDIETLTEYSKFEKIKTSALVANGVADLVTLYQSLSKMKEESIIAGESAK